MNFLLSPKVPLFIQIQAEAEGSVLEVKVATTGGGVRTLSQRHLLISPSPREQRPRYQPKAAPLERESGTAPHPRARLTLKLDANTRRRSRNSRCPRVTTASLPLTLMEVYKLLFL